VDVTTAAGARSVILTHISWPGHIKAAPLWPNLTLLLLLLRLLLLHELLLLLSCHNTACLGISARQLSDEVGGKADAPV
jgi:hypothetical protein